MIGFGELRKRSMEWQQDITAVERLYATDWLLKGFYDHPLLARTLVLRGAAALRYAYFPDYRAPAEPEFLSTIGLERQAQWNAFREAADSATAASGVKYLLLDLGRGMADFDYTGPLGRRSAAQPRIHVLLADGAPRLPPVTFPLIYPFSDVCTATVFVLALEEFIAERIAAVSRTMARALDVHDLWFALTHGKGQVDLARARALSEEIARNKQAGAQLPGTLFKPEYSASLNRAWDAALKNIPRHPSLIQVEQETTQIWNNVGAQVS